MPVCIVALNTMISVWLPAVRAHIREHRGGGGGVIPPPSLPPPPPPSSLLSLSLSQFSLDPHPAKTWRRNILTQREIIFLEDGESADSCSCIMTCWITALGIRWMYGQKNAHVLTPISGDHFRRGEERRGCWSWVLLLTSQWFNSSHHRPQLQTVDHIRVWALGSATEVIKYNLLCVKVFWVVR